LSVPKKDRRKVTIQAIFIALFAIVGALLRMIIAQLFGEACANPGTVGWLSAGAPLCVTKDGQTHQQGGIVFADLPSNLLGSFLMGLWQDYAVLGLAVPMSIAWLRPDHPLQKASFLHTAFKTGFCGSLTTFSSWNSEMVVMIFGTDQSRNTQIWSALFGYIIGMETSLGSFACGCSFARYVHGKINPLLALERDAMRMKREQGVHLNLELPDFERRFLSDLKIIESAPGSTELHPIDRIDDLRIWRESTVDIRRVGHPLLPVLLDVENAVFVHHRPIPPQAESIARAEGWAVDNLLEYVTAKQTSDMDMLPSISSGSHGIKNNYYSTTSLSSISWDNLKWFQLPFAATVCGSVMVLLLLGIFIVNAPNAIAATNRTMMYAMLFAPSGALLRWKLSEFNGNFPYFPEQWRWLPAGTFLANIIGSLVSITAVAMEYRIGNDSNSFWAVGTIRAIRVGFAGSLTTVSTFVAEVSHFMHSKTDHAYPYILTTLCTACSLSCIVFALIVFVP
jgi:fluoride ion exporter CrcB/FEX